MPVPGVSAACFDSLGRCTWPSAQHFPKQETFKHGREENLLVDTESRACESLYVEALRP